MLREESGGKAPDEDALHSPWASLSPVVALPFR